MRSFVFCSWGWKIVAFTPALPNIGTNKHKQPFILNRMAEAPAHVAAACEEATGPDREAARGEHPEPRSSGAESVLTMLTELNNISCR